VKAVEKPKALAVGRDPWHTDDCGQGRPDGGGPQLEAKVEPIFHPDSYGYRPRRSALDAVGHVGSGAGKTDWVIDLDIQKFFDSVDHALMVRRWMAPRRCSVGGCCM